MLKTETGKTRVVVKQGSTAARTIFDPGSSKLLTATTKTPLTLEEIEKRFMRNYGAPKHSALFATETVLNSLGFDLHDLSELKEKRILDLACGSSILRWKPWLARFLNEAGARVVGIDQESLRDEKFEKHELDISAKGALDFLERGSFDYAVCRGLMPLNGLGSGDYSSRLILKDGTSMEDMRVELLAQITRVLKEGGRAFVNVSDIDRLYGVFIKQEGKLILEKTV